MENEIETLEGCMCQYIPEALRTQVDAIAETTGAYASQVVTAALQIGLAVLIGKTPALLTSLAETKHGGKIKQKRTRGKLSGAGL